MFWHCIQEFLIINLWDFLSTPVAADSFRACTSGFTQPSQFRELIDAVRLECPKTNCHNTLLDASRYVAVHQSTSQPFL